MNVYRKRYKNYLSLISCVLRSDYPIKAINRYGKISQFDDYQEVYYDLTELDVDPACDVAYINDLKFHGGKTNGDIVNIFKKNEYSFLPVNGKEVVDIGANIGDSSIYFANRGAKYVIAIEPNKTSYDCAAQNIAINGYSAKIKLIMAACGPNDTILSSEQDVEFLTLKTLIQKYCSCPEILKIDCEGCEYDFILNASGNDLSRFSHIQIEYHFGYQNLKTKLEACGFEVICTRPSFFLPPKKNKLTWSLTWSLSNGEVRKARSMFIGWLYATAKDL